MEFRFGLGEAECSLPLVPRRYVLLPAARCSLSGAPLEERDAYPFRRQATSFVGCPPLCCILGVRIGGLIFWFPWWPGTHLTVSVFSCSYSTLASLIISITMSCPGPGASGRIHSTAACESVPLQSRDARRWTPLMMAKSSVSQTSCWFPA